jgi:hypothetical protein
VVSRKTTRERKRIGPNFSKTGFDYTSLKDGRNGREVEAITLYDALRGLRNVAIKSDCEGAEEFFFDDADLSHVYAIQLEYHNGCGKKVKDTLEGKGFKVHGRLKSEADYLYATDYLYAERS